MSKRENRNDYLCCSGILHFAFLCQAFLGRNAVIMVCLPVTAQKTSHKQPPLSCGVVCTEKVPESEYYCFFFFSSYVKILTSKMMVLGYGGGGGCVL